MKKILMVALDFPPGQSAGVQRTLKFCEYLPGLGWEPHVLTVPDFVHERIDHDAVVPDKLKQNVHRAFAFNSAKNLAIKGHYFEFTATPDRYFTWYFHAVMLGKRLSRQLDIDAIWSTYPYPTAHWIALRLSKLTDIPWVADFRDPFSYHVLPSGKPNVKACWINEQTVKNAHTLIFTTNQAAQYTKEAHPEISAEKFTVIENGFNEEAFHSIESQKIERPSKTDNVYRLIHSGILYRKGRNPNGLFEALVRLKHDGHISRDTFRVVFRGIDKDFEFSDLLKKLDLAEFCEFLPKISYIGSLREMMESDALLLLQGKEFNNQIPGKLYEYLRSKRPILALTDSTGATGELLQDVDHAHIAGIDDVDGIYSAIRKLMSSEVADDFDYKRYSRKCQANLFVNTLNSIVDR